MGRSRMTNRSLMFDPARTDGRSKQARRFRDIMNELLQLVNPPSVQHELMARRVAGLAVGLEDVERRMAAGEKFSSEELYQYGCATDRVARLIRQWFKPVPQRRAKGQSLTPEAHAALLRAIRHEPGHRRGRPVPSLSAASRETLMACHATFAEGLAHDAPRQLPRVRDLGSLRRARLCR